MTFLVTPVLFCVMAASLRSDMHNSISRWRNSFIRLHDIVALGGLVTKSASYHIKLHLQSQRLPFSFVHVYHVRKCPFARKAISISLVRSTVLAKESSMWRLHQYLICVEHVLCFESCMLCRLCLSLAQWIEWFTTGGVCAYISRKFVFVIQSVPSAPRASDSQSNSEQLNAAFFLSRLFSG